LNQTLQRGITESPAWRKSRKKRLQDQELLLRNQAKQLLYAIPPLDIAEELNTNGRVQHRRLENIAILMTDIVGFTPYCEIHSPEQVVANLQEPSDCFGSILAKYNLEKINAPGAAFMAASKPSRLPRQVVIACVHFGLELNSAISLLASGLQIRIGIHIGPVVAGVVGRKKFRYSLFGDTVNTAARIQRNGQS
jgi:class 3 adenylate cyclase